VLKSVALERWRQRSSETVSSTLTPNLLRHFEGTVHVVATATTESYQAGDPQMDPPESRSPHEGARRTIYLSMLHPAATATKDSRLLALARWIRVRSYERLVQSCKESVWVIT
jgi:hypothetical protein